MHDATTFCTNCRQAMRWRLVFDGELEVHADITSCPHCDCEVEVLELSAQVRRALADIRRGEAT